MSLPQIGENVYIESANEIGRVTRIDGNSVRVKFGTGPGASKKFEIIVKEEYVETVINFSIFGIGNFSGKIIKASRTIQYI